MLAWPPALGSLASRRLPSLSCSFQSHKTKHYHPRSHTKSAGLSPSFSNGCGQFAQTGNSFPLSTTESCVLSPNPTPSATKGRGGHHPMEFPGSAQSLDGGGKSDTHSLPAPCSTRRGCSPRVPNQEFHQRTPATQHTHSTAKRTNPKPFTLGVKGVFLEGFMHGMLVPLISHKEKLSGPCLFCQLKPHRIKAQFCQSQ